MKYKKSIIALAILGALFIFGVPHKLPKNTYSMIVRDRDGNLLNAKISPDGQWRFPPQDTVPERFGTCIVQFEDKRFFNHVGIDVLAVAEAIKINLKANEIRRGGSTITMQLMRLSRKGKSRNMVNKIIEMILALRYELSNNKKEILRQYASNAPFGNNVVGLEAASWRYFGKKTSSLSWAESATLAVLPNAPSLIHLGKNRNQLLTKRNNLLASLHLAQLISQEEYDLALLEVIPPVPLDLPSLAPHATASFGKVIPKNSTIDKSIQSLANQSLDRHYKSYMQEAILNGAILILDNNTGEVLAYIGNTNDASEKYVDMVTAKRSSGSLLKPILYAAMQDEGLLSPQQLIEDIPININGFVPQNFDKKYRGAVKADEALAMSLNIPFVVAQKSYGTQKFINLLNKLKIESINKSESHYGLSLILGGAELSLWEICGAYASLARTLTTYTNFDSRYNIYDIHSPRLSAQEHVKAYASNPTTLSAGAIYTTFESLTKLQRPDEEGQWQYFSSSSKIAWKTGTSFGHKDAWAVGVNPKYTVGVWIGNASGEGRAGLTGAYKAAPILFDIFNRLPACDWFSKPYDALEKVSICSHSGYIASPLCTNTDTSYIVRTNASKKLCIYHKNIYTNKEGTERVTQLCCNGEGKTTAWFDLPPSIVYYYKNHHPEYKPLPPYSSNCKNEAEASLNEAVGIIYPSMMAKIYIPRNLSNQKENIIARASSSKQEATLFWHLDGEYLGSTRDDHALALQCSSGIHKLTITDEVGYKCTRKFEVVNE